MLDRLDRMDRLDKLDKLDKLDWLDMKLTFSFCSLSQTNCIFTTAL